MRGLHIALALLIGACGGAARGSIVNAARQGDLDRAMSEYETVRSDDGPDLDLLAEIAGALLEREATGDDEERSQAAFVQLTLAGTASEGLLERLGEHRRERVRARALGILARRGEDDAKEALRSMVDSEDPVVIAAALEGLDPHEETARLRSYLSHSSEEVRTTAASLLIRSAPDDETRIALAEIARVDPSARVRGAAVRSLGNYGPAALEPLRERLSDADMSVRLSAVGALADADRERAIAILGGMLDMGPSPASVEAARVLAQVPIPEDQPMPDGVVMARAFLKRALVVGEPRVRAQAGIALMALGRDEDLDAALEQALQDEADAIVRVTIASALRLRDRDAPVARAALEGLLDTSGMARVQAAAALADEELPKALEVLRDVIEVGAPPEKRVAVRALARLAMRPDEVRKVLLDRDPILRIHAAGAILSARAARG